MYNNKLVRAYQMAPSYIPNSLAKKPVDIRTSLGPVDREFANVETEGGETVYLPNKGGLPAHYKINGPRHYEGGVPMSIPPDSFIYSDTASMRIKDPELQAEFGMPVAKKGYTPAEIAKKYDLNKYRKILADPMSDKLQINTAEMVIANYQIKLAKLALIQESMKGFPNGIPLVAMPYIAKYQLDASQFLPTELREGVMNEGAMQQMPEARYGGGLRKFQPGGANTPASVSNNYVNIPGQGQVRLNRFQRKQLERQRQLQLLTQAMQNLAVEEKEPEVTADLSTGVFYKTDANGNPYYVDGKGVRITKFDKAYYGTNNIPTEGNTRIIERNGKRYKVTVNQKKGSVDQTKVVDKDKATQAGQIYEENGKYYEVQGYDTTKPIGSTKSGSDLYTGDINKDKTKAGEILNRLAKDDHAVYHTTPFVVNGKERKPGWEIKSSARGAMNTDEKEFLTDFLSLGKQSQQLGPDSTPEYNISLQGSDKGFYGYTNPDFYEYRFWKAEHMDQKASDWDGLDADEKKKNRSRMLTTLGFDVENDDFIKNNLDKPENLYTEDFVSGRKKAKHRKYGELGFTDSIENWFNPEDFRPGIGDDKKLGLEHADAFSYEKGLKDITPEDSVTETELLEKAKSPSYTSGDDYAPWWLQDVIRTAGAAADYFSIKKYMPTKFQYNPYVPEPTFYDPSREIAALQETANIATDLVSGAGNRGASTYSARAAAIQGTAAEQIANVMGRYNTQNVGVANEFAYKAADIMNESQVKNLAAAQTYVDQVNTVNQNYDNAKRAAREQLRSSYIDAVTNRANAQVLNTLYPNYQIDPSSGGMMYFNKGEKMVPGQESANATAAAANAFIEWRKDNMDLSDESAINLWTGLSKRGASTSANSEYADAYLNMMKSGFDKSPVQNYYQKEGGVKLPYLYTVGY